MIFHEWFHAKKSKKEQVLRIGGIAGSGKAQPDDTMIPTPNGWMRLDQLKVGDSVFGLAGNPVKVTGIYPQGEKRLYEITFSDGRVSRSSKDHLWPVYYREKNEYDVLMLKELINVINREGENVYYSPTCKPAQFIETPVYHDPWTIGVMAHCADFRKDQLTLVDIPEWLDDAFRKALVMRSEMVDDDTYQYFTMGAFYPALNRTYTPKPIQTVDVINDIPEWKIRRPAEPRIPKIYMTNSVDIRRKLLSGLMDAGGSISSKKFRVRYSGTNLGLAEDVQELCWSLGYQARLEETDSAYVVHIHCSNYEKRFLFHANEKYRKRALMSASKKSSWGTDDGYDRLQIVSIKKLDQKVHMRCIKVDHPLHLYLTEQYIVTHNTTLLKYLVASEEFTQKECMVVSYTGQAVNVLRQSGVMAKTIHSAFMKSKEEPLKVNGKIVYRRGVPVMTTVWVPVKSIPSSVKLIIVDEASFLPEKLEDQLKSYGVPILEMGDPVQLPPVSGVQCFQMDRLDYFLTEVMRQNKDSDIFRLASAIRAGDRIRLDDYGNQVKFLHAKESVTDTFFQYRPFFKSSDLILVTTNKTRQTITDLYREHIVKTKSPYPVKGEPLICRRNNWNISLGPYPLTNGTIGRARYNVMRSGIDRSQHVYYIDFQPLFVDNDYYDNLMCDLDFLLEPFGSDKSSIKQYTPGEKLEYAHAITVHASQGSQANEVLFMDTEGYGDPEFLMRLRYTAVTRAVNRLWYVILHARYAYKDAWANGYF